ncbi:glycoside hydrolase family 3 protein [Pararhodobacter sp. SW119]|uniref:glycoside hydrolase family 3 protein n=1 Tax=Pararhodobacter sp. SW119 TaxID=2780075 RepID=UPI001ADF3F3D|nr:glycoside hydrolase family 3 protein [Pararhodobacter sp. SW119]
MTGATILGCAGPRLTAAEARFFAEARPWGFILFRRNIEDADQTRALVDDLRSSLGWHAPVFVDQEGGSVQRLRPPLARDWPDARHQPGGARAAWLRHRLMAAELRALGIDGDCAPVIDVAGRATHPFLARRCWSDDPAQVAALGGAAARGLLDGGVLPVIKHLPGHGSAAADSHHQLPRVTASLDTLRARDFVPVRALKDLPLGMTAHVVYDALDPSLPGTVSPPVIAYLRDVLGFDGLLMTDDITMGALDGTMGDRAAAAIAAGCDIVLHCTGDAAEMAQVVAAAGTLSPAAARRAARALEARITPQPIDIAALEAEFDRLTGGTDAGT